MIAALLALALAAAPDDAPPELPPSVPASKPAAQEDAPSLPPSAPVKKAEPKPAAPKAAEPKPAAPPKPEPRPAEPRAAEPKPAQAKPADATAGGEGPPALPPTTRPGAAPAAAPAAAAPTEEAAADEPAAAEAPADSYSPPSAAAATGLQINGYADVGFARARGDGTSFSPNDVRIPADYGVDAFAPMVNSRGDVASTDSKGRFLNGFLPRSVGIGGAGSFLLNTVDLDVKYQPASAPVLLFTRLQVLPRFASGTDTRFVLEQAFARVLPFSTQELALFVGKFDSAFGIEYLENEANLRLGVTPSLVSRYTTGQELGAKVFYRVQIPGIWSALSLNTAATNGSNLVESLQPADVSLTGAPVLSARLGYELNLPAVQVKLGASGMRGPRNDQHLRNVRQWAWGFDARAIVGPLSVSAELLHVRQDGGDADKIDGLGAQTSVSGFLARGGYVTAALSQPLDWGPLRKVAVYGRYGRRYAQFEGYTPIAVDRITAGVHADLWESVALKAEYLWNRELWGAPQVDNDVFTSSVVYSW